MDIKEVLFVAVIAIIITAPFSSSKEEKKAEIAAQIEKNNAVVCKDEQCKEEKNKVHAGLIASMAALNKSFKRRHFRH